MDACRHAVVSSADLSCLFEALKARGHCLVGPAAREGAIIHDQTKAIDDESVGWTDWPDDGKYRLKENQESEHARR
jgi:hypothetical protein